MLIAAKSLLGLLTVLPGAYFFLVLTGAVQVSFNQLSALHDAAMILTLLLAAFYVTNALTNRRVSPEKRVLWAVLLLFAGFFSQAVYFWQYIWHRSSRR